MPEHSPEFKALHCSVRSSGCKFELVFSLTSCVHLSLPGQVKCNLNLEQRWEQIGVHVLVALAI